MTATPRRHRPARGRRRLRTAAARPAAAARCWPRSCCSSLLFGAGSLRYDSFFSGQVLLNLFIDNAFLIVLAVGMTFVILTGGIDLSRRVGGGAVRRCSPRKLLSRGWGPVPVMVAGAGHRRRRSGWLMGAGHPLLRDPAVHRHAGRHVPGPRPLLRDQRRVHPDQRPAVHRHRPGTRSRCPATRSSARRGRRGGRGRRRPPTCCTPPASAARVYAVGGNAALGDADGPAGGPDQDRRLRDQRVLLGDRRAAVRLLHAVGLQPARGRHGAGRHRRRRHRRHPALRRGRATSSARCSACWCSA